MIVNKSASAKEGTIVRSQIGIVIPTYNAAKDWARLKGALRLQNFPAAQVLIIDSNSEDGTADLAAAEGFQVLAIDRTDFNHGATRQLAVQTLPWARILIYLTQDAVPANEDALDRLLAAFEDTKVAAAYGRQLPRPGAGPIEAHAREFNYPEKGGTRDFESRHTLGIKATFLSNSFSAYRVDALCSVGGFPSDVIMAEDAIVAGKLLIAGWKTAYVADARVYHSHSFTIAQEFRRYFDIGVYHRRESWLRERFGTPGGEGRRFVISELRFLWPQHLHLIPIALMRTASKAIGYRLGLNESHLGTKWPKRLSYHKGFWTQPTGTP